MKKILLGVAVAAACCLAGCGAPETDGYEFLNEMLRADYSEIALTVTSDFGGGLILTDEYRITYPGGKTEVSYTVQRFAEPGLGSETASDPVVTYEGKAVIQSGAVVSVEGDDVGISAAVAERGLTFRAKYFENADLTGIYLKADVKDAEGFFGAPVEGGNMKITAVFLELFSSIEVTYSTGGCSVVYEYRFTP